MVWDKAPRIRRTNMPPGQQLARGKIDVELHGTKLLGGFTLIRAAQRSGDSSDQEPCLLIKHRDEYADPSWDIKSPEFDRSVLTGRTLKEIEEGVRERLAGSGGPMLEWRPLVSIANSPSIRNLPKRKIWSNRYGRRG